MSKLVCISGEHVLESLEFEIIEEKTRAYQLALEQLFPVPLMFLQPYIKDYKRKLQRQYQLIIHAAKAVLSNPQKKQILIRAHFPEYYQRDPIYAILLLYIPPIFAPPYIRDVLNQLKRLNKRYFLRKINFMLILLKKLESIQGEMLHSTEEILRRLFTNKNLLYEFMYSHIEIEQKKYRIIKKGGDWSHLSPLDYFHSFSITTVPFYHYVSHIWETIDQILPPILKAKISDMYHIKTLPNGELEIVKGGKYRYKLVKEFPRPPQVMMEIFHDPEILMKHYPSKNIQIEKLASDRLRYTISEKIPLMKIVLKYDLVCQFKGNIEEWWVENSNYIKEMTGFAVYEETPGGHCRYADILVQFSLDDSLKPFEDMIIPALEQMGRKNIEQLMENIYQYLITQDSSLANTHRDECQEAS